MVSDDCRHLCPITLEEIRHGIQLRGVWFELEAVVDMLIMGQARHPYDRKLLTKNDLRAIHKACECDETSAARLTELGWTDVEKFVAEVYDNGRHGKHRERRGGCCFGIRYCATAFTYALGVMSIAFLALLVVS